IICNKGYRLEGSEYMTCGNNGWTPALPRCIEVICDAPRINNAVIVGRGYTRYRYGASIQFRCNKGYRMEGSDRLKCEQYGWNPPPPQCSVITCLEPPTLTNGQFIPLKASYKYGEIVTYNCVEGFKLYGSPTISCSDNGMFETSLSACRESFCDPPLIQNAVIDETSRSPAYRYQTSIKISCNKGYRLEGSEYMTCGNNGWTPALPRCIEVICDAPRINNAVIVGRGYKWYRYGASIQFRCNKGYRMEGSDRLKCEENGWNPPPPQCSVITCLEPPTINNGQFIPLKDSYKYGETVTYNCVEGFKLYGSPTISCSDNGMFETSLSACREIFCDPPLIKNAVIDETSRSPAYRYQTSIKISCNKGYRLEGSEYMTCENDGWTPALPRCVEVICDVPRINNAVIVGRGYKWYRYGASIQFRCNKGYRMEGSDRLKCEENGWNPPPPQCSVITCLEPPTITNGQFIPLKASYKYGETVTYNCVEGFKLYGSPTISCSDDGMFETSLPECRAIGF
ncbi:sushi, von Willebrand factor type A, EGF and pentraxin domain-containing protein 1 isoform X5, partial [Silurus asotus]